MLRQLADALAHCHAQRVVHRDIKSSNIFLAQGGKVLLGDFGVAKVCLHASAKLKPQLTGFPFFGATFMASSSHLSCIFHLDSSLPGTTNALFLATADPLRLSRRATVRGTPSLSQALPALPPELHPRTHLS